MDDADLVARARGGDQSAFAAIYDRYGDAVFDFCAGMLRDRDRGADACQETFVLAWERLGQLRDPSKLRAWLYAIARSRALAEIRRRDRVRPVDDFTAVPSTRPEGEEAVTSQELTRLVWEAADGLGDRDRVLLDLHLRQGLEGDELADAVGVSTQHCHVLMSRLRDRVERSIGALLVARLGRSDCAELQALLADWDGRFSRAVRGRVTRHVESCDRCSEKRAALASPWALAGALPGLVAPPELRDGVLEQIRHVAEGRPSGIAAPRFGRDGFPAPLVRRRSRRGVVAAAVVGLVLVVGLTLALLSGGRSHKVATGGPATAASSSASREDGRRSVGERPHEADDVAVDTTTTDPGSPGSAAAAGGTNPSAAAGSGAGQAGGSASSAPGSGSGTATGGSTPAAPPPGPAPAPPELDGPTIHAAFADPDEIYEETPVCAALPLQTTLVAEVTDASGVAEVFATWDLAAWGPQSTPLDPVGGDAWAAVVGPYPTGTVAVGEVEDVVVTITAVDVHGNPAATEVFLALLDEAYCP